MAIFHCQVKVVSRATGRSSVAASAYRSGTSLHNDKEGRTYDFSRRSGVVQADIVIPKGSDAEWALDRNALWNAVEAKEKRKDSRVAREFEIALPHELDEEEREELTRHFAQQLADRFGTAVDFAIHKPDPRGSEKNHHAHLMMTTRRVDADGLGEKSIIEWENKKLLKERLPTTSMQMKEVRLAWELVANEALERAGIDARIDHRSNAARGLELEPTRHVGVHATAVQRQGGVIERERMDAETARLNADIVQEKPEQIITLVSGERSVFTREDLARALHRYVHDDNDAFQAAFTRIMASPELVALRSDKADGIERFTTREMFDLEAGMIARAERLAGDRSHVVSPDHVAYAMHIQDQEIKKAVAAKTAIKVARGEMTETERAAAIESAGLSDEQRQAIAHVTTGSRMAQVVGIAGAGKSTMLAAARQAWEAQGYRVHGAALSGKATFGLQDSSGIESRTLASWAQRWKMERGQIGRGDVFVIDEAGMIGSRQMARFIEEAEARGAKIVLVGDHEQLQSIGAGAAFRAIGERTGFAELNGVLRQLVDWQAEATQQFAKQATTEALETYRSHGDIVMESDRETTRGRIVADYLADRGERPEGSRVILAHQRADVAALNAEVRSVLQERGELARGAEDGERVFQTDAGKRSFAAGDRMVFLENNKSLGVMNGTLGTVERVAGNRISVALDNGNRIEVPADQYSAFDHGYATTIHKSQGDTVDRAFVLASKSMDRHMTYVAMTRHRDGAKLYAATEDFQRGGGRLVAHGRAPFENQPGKRESYFVTLADEKGERRTVWGVDLERVMKDAAPEIGDRIALEVTGQEAVTLPDGTTAHRNTWATIGADDLAYKQLERQLSRDGSKEISLDYMPMTREEREEAKAAQERPAPEEEAAPAPPPNLDPHARGIDRTAYFAARDKALAERAARFDGPESRAHVPASPERAQPAAPAVPRSEPQRRPFDRAAAYEALKSKVPPPVDKRSEPPAAPAVTPKIPGVIADRHAAADEAHKKAEAEKAAARLRPDYGDRFD
ncbi:Ti-type conjugative transfer relaxase TraA [Agrobacterium tumefaciens]|uniref:Ti-type conjugative transfer relaxase TraA n=1 Tax=Agrobacterium tumefaciens TaxID=358 RepID=UPI0015734C43|nr:Ti-type conjugative transfer relaxase TraA [Agrobacterium tumefaciens]NTD85729.1 Ti-type conjugative transfer relaxase TraA [Agrobacterium tumefaciens]NTD89717.1 Ti-type conjugative transfer relaxase TraA [Agrobacterium tumefaciens]NTE21998.1 Ti-type conjugative transfer relaxase TraA [Agrobacterium tumefaciens]NTE31648.1 Ti-type conjugative transfer relaxase TraA [Agrobacterium tumefaciens]NTE41891.1 Ti-type conjugative transfer relaxase TraA [Agrobacterium tumefaciens]